MANRLSTLVALSLLLGFAILTPAGPAQAATPGEACIFNAPSGVSASSGLIGHVAWSFKVDDSKWVFGSTDGGSPQKSKTWIEVGSKSDMLRQFYSEAAPVGYYTQYKCKVVDDAQILLAYNRALESAEKGYLFVVDNCLHEAVAVMKLYGLDDMADPLLRPLPNDYFDVNLPVGTDQWRGPIELVDPSSDAGAAGDIPKSFLGTWSGDITQQNPPIPPYSLSATIQQGEIGSTVGSGNYTGTDPCAVHWTLLSASDDQIVVNEVVDSGTCFSDIEITLADLGGGTLSYDFEDGNGRGTLSR